MTGKEPFTQKNQPLGFDVQDYWRFTYSSLWAQRGKIAEYLICKALGIEKPYNDKAWMLWDVNYDAIRIEVKETSLFQEWRGDNNPSPQNYFSIEGAFSDYRNPFSKFCRQSDLYVFCVNKGVTETEANPLDVDNWDFYLMKTEDINRLCDRGTERKQMAKTLSLSRLLSFEKKGIAYKVEYKMLKPVIDHFVFSHEEKKSFYIRRIAEGIVYSTPPDQLSELSRQTIEDWVLGRSLYCDDEAILKLVRGKYLSDQQPMVMMYDSEDAYVEMDEKQVTLTYKHGGKGFNLDLRHQPRWMTDPGAFFKIIADLLEPNKEQLSKERYIIDTVIRY